MPQMIEVVVEPEDGLFLPEGWELVEEESVKELDGPAILGDVEFLNEGESCVGGEEALGRAKKFGNRAGLRRAHALLRQHYLIPDDWQDKMLMFIGTVVHDRLGLRFVPYLVRFGYRWFLSWWWLDCNFRSSHRIVHLHK